MSLSYLKDLQPREGNPVKHHLIYSQQVQKGAEREIGPPENVLTFTSTLADFGSEFPCDFSGGNTT